MYHISIKVFIVIEDESIFKNTFSETFIMSFLILILSVDMETGNFGSKHVLRYYITKIIKILKKNAIT